MDVVSSRYPLLKANVAPDGAFGPVCGVGVTVSVPGVKLIAVLDVAS